MHDDDNDDDDVDGDGGGGAAAARRWQRERLRSQIERILLHREQRVVAATSSSSAAARASTPPARSTTMTASLTSSLISLSGVSAARWQAVSDAKQRTAAVDDARSAAIVTVGRRADVADVHGDRDSDSHDSGDESSSIQHERSDRVRARVPVRASATAAEDERGGQHHHAARASNGDVVVIAPSADADAVADGATRVTVVDLAAPDGAVGELTPPLDAALESGMAYGAIWRQAYGLGGVSPLVALALAPLDVDALGELPPSLARGGDDVDSNADGTADSGDADSAAIVDVDVREHEGAADTNSPHGAQDAPDDDALDDDELGLVPFHAESPNSTAEHAPTPAHAALQQEGRATPDVLAGTAASSVVLAPHSELASVTVGAPAMSASRASVSSTASSVAAWRGIVQSSLSSLPAPPLRRGSSGRDLMQQQQQQQPMSPGSDMRRSLRSVEDLARDKVKDLLRLRMPNQPSSEGSSGPPSAPGSPLLDAVRPISFDGAVDVVAVAGVAAGSRASTPDVLRASLGSVTSAAIAAPPHLPASPSGARASFARFGAGTPVGSAVASPLLSASNPRVVMQKAPPRHASWTAAPTDARGSPEAPAGRRFVSEVQLEAALSPQLMLDDPVVLLREWQAQGVRAEDGSVPRVPAPSPRPTSVSSVRRPSSVLDVLRAISDQSSVAGVISGMRPSPGSTPTGSPAPDAALSTSSSPIVSPALAAASDTGAQSARTVAPQDRRRRRAPRGNGAEERSGDPPRDDAAAGAGAGAGAGDATSATSSRSPGAPASDSPVDDASGRLSPAIVVLAPSDGAPAPSAGVPTSEQPRAPARAGTLAQSALSPAPLRQIDAAEAARLALGLQPATTRPADSTAADGGSGSGSGGGGGGGRASRPAADVGGDSGASSVAPRSTPAAHVSPVVGAARPPRPTSAGFTREGDALRRKQRQDDSAAAQDRAHELPLAAVVSVPAGLDAREASALPDLSAAPSVPPPLHVHAPSLRESQADEPRRRSTASAGGEIEADDGDERARARLHVSDVASEDDGAEQRPGGARRSSHRRSASGGAGVGSAMNAARRAGSYSQQHLLRAGLLTPPSTLRRELLGSRGGRAGTGGGPSGDAAAAASAGDDDAAVRLWTLALSKRSDVPVDGGAANASPGADADADANADETSASRGAAARLSPMLLLASGTQPRESPSGAADDADHGDAVPVRARRTPVSPAVLSVPTASPDGSPTAMAAPLPPAVRRRAERSVSPASVLVAEEEVEAAVAPAPTHASQSTSPRVPSPTRSSPSASPSPSPSPSHGRGTDGVAGAATLAVPPTRGLHRRGASGPTALLTAPQRDEANAHAQASGAPAVPPLRLGAGVVAGGAERGAVQDMWLEVLPHFRADGVPVGSSRSLASQPGASAAGDTSTLGASASATGRSPTPPGPMTLRQQARVARRALARERASPAVPSPGRPPSPTLRVPASPVARPIVRRFHGPTALAVAWLPVPTADVLRFAACSDDERERLREQPAAYSVFRCAFSNSGRAMPGSLLEFDCGAHTSAVDSDVLPDVVYGYVVCAHVGGTPAPPSPPCYVRLVSSWCRRDDANNT